MPTMIVNEDGEPLGFDYPEYDTFPEDYGDDYSDDDYDEGDFEDDTFRSEQESDLAEEWN